MYSHANPDHVKLHFKLLLGWLQSVGMCTRKAQATRALSVPLHMYAKQPGNWALFVLLRNDLICEMTKEWSEVRQANLEALKRRGGTKMKNHEIENEEKALIGAKSRVMLLLCHMFGVVPIHPCTSDVLPCLKNMEPEIETVLRSHNENVRSVFREFCSMAERTEKTFEMPLSKLKCDDDDVKSNKNSSSLSPFVVKSFDEDEGFDLRACRHDVYVDESMIPVLELDGSRKSSWLIDLLKHRNLGRIHREHYVSPEQIWTKASNFMNAVRSACQGLKTYIHMFQWNDTLDHDDADIDEKKEEGEKKSAEVEKQGDKNEDDDDSDNSSSEADDWDADGVAESWENAFDSDSDSDTKEEKDEDDQDEEKNLSRPELSSRRSSSSKKSSGTSSGLTVERLELVHEIFELLLNEVTECINESFDAFSYTNEMAYAEWIERLLSKE